MEPKEKGRDNIMKASRDVETDGDRLIEEQINSLIDNQID